MSSKTILDFFKGQNTNVLCPACGLSLPKSKLNFHLDTECSSSPSKEEKNICSEIYPSSSKIFHSPSIKLKSKRNSKISSKMNTTKISKLSLKHQRMNTSNKITSALKNENDVKEIEVITLHEDLSPSIDSTTVNKKNKNIDMSQNPEQTNIESASDDIVQKESPLSIKTSEVFSKFNVTVINNLNQSTCVEEIKEKDNFDKFKASNDTNYNNDPKSAVKTLSKKTDIANELNSTLLCDASVDVSQINEVQLHSDTNIDSDVIRVLKDAEACLEADDNVFTENSETSEQTKMYSPYYIANFKHILNTVLNDEYNKILFNEEDMDYIKAFETSSESAQKLYVRLFQRKYKWLRLNKINYPNITLDPEKPLNELVSAGLIDSGLDKIDLNTALDLLSLPEAKIIGKHFKLNLTGKNKADISQMLLKHCTQHKSVFFCNGKNTISHMVLKKIKDVLGPCYRLSLLPKRLFTRILMLFSLPTMSEDDDDAAGGQQQQLLTLLQVNKGEITFPNYKINRQMMIFIGRDELVRYEEAKQLENDITNAVESKNFELAKELYLNARDEFDNQLTCPFAERPASLPTFLKKFSSFHIYVRCMTAGVDILQRLRQYKEAVELLKRLLDQKVFCQDYRGRWWDRMALNLEQHLKQPQKALEAIKKGITDKNVRVGYRYSLLTRALRILKSVDENDKLKKEILEAANVVEAPKVIIRGRLFPRNILGRRHVFISSSTVSEEDDITVLGVEQLAIEHYKNEGFTEGLHGEGSTFHAVYGLLFWDIIYDGDIPDAFISPYQTHPLDLNHDSFFIRREKQIMNHLETLRTSTIEEIKEIIRVSWETHFGQSSLVMWDHFTDVEHILGLIACMGNNLLCGICERLARDFRFTRSGVPDLVVWNPESLQLKIVEVKGPGDKLSSKQILWLDYLLKLGAQAEVCHVEAVGSKKLRRD